MSVDKCLTCRLKLSKGSLILIDAERRRQDDKWGVQKHSDEVWLTILMEEVGELSKEMLEKKFGRPADSFKHGVKLLQELIQVAAVAQAWLECRTNNNPSMALLEILKNKVEV